MTISVVNDTNERTQKRKVHKTENLITSRFAKPELSETCHTAI